MGFTLGSLSLLSYVTIHHLPTGGLLTVDWALPH